MIRRKCAICSVSLFGIINKFCWRRTVVLPPEEAPPTVRGACVCVYSGPTEHPHQGYQGRESERPEVDRSVIHGTLGLLYLFFRPMLIIIAVAVGVVVFVLRL